MVTSLFVFVFLCASLRSFDYCAPDTCVPPAYNQSCCCVQPCLELNYTTLNPIFPGVWTVLSHFYFEDLFETNNRMIVVAVQHDAAPYAVLINGVQLCPLTLASLKQLDKVLPIKHIISPGDWHYLFLPQYLTAFPNATIHIPPGRIQREDPVHSKFYTLIDMLNPLPFLKPTIVAIPFQGLQQGPADGWHWFDHRNEFLFYVRKAKLLVAGDTLFFEMCNVNSTNGQITFNPQGMHMIANVTQALGTASLISTLDFNNFINIHGMPGSLSFNNPKSLISSALQFLQT